MTATHLRAPQRSGSESWVVPIGEWADKTVAILGGGPSLVRTPPELTRRVRTIAVNEAGLTYRPDADILFFADGEARWFGWNGDRVRKLSRARRIVTRTPILNTQGVRILRLAPTRPDVALSRDPTRLAGFCSGACAINLAYLLGAERIVLLGFDMRPGSWHREHRLPTRDDVYERRMLPSLRAMCGEVRAAGHEVVCATPGSAIDFLPHAHPEEVLR